MSEAVRLGDFVLKIPSRSSLRYGYRIALVVVLILAVAGCAGGPTIDESRVDDGARSGLTDRSLPTTPAERLKAMSLREQIGQRFIIYVPRDFGASIAGGDVARDYVALVKEGAPAGMIVYPWNYADRDDLIRLTDKLQRLAPYNPLGGKFLIAADQEGGRVAAYRFRDLPRFPSAADVARQATADVSRLGAAREDRVPPPADGDYVRSVAYITGRDLASVGISFNFAPVVDLSATADRSIIGDRSWGGDAETVASFATAYLDGMLAAGVIPTIKHYPGHGVTRVDSHGRLPIVDMTERELRSTHLIPFERAIEAGAPAVMTAHILFPEIDPKFPVTISERFLHDILRRDLGFDGVVVSDGLSMGALADNYDIDLVLERALRLDVDLILLHDRYDFREIVQRVERLLEDGRVRAVDIERGALRVLQLKAKYGLLE